jgi:hypothetical protein
MSNKWYRAALGLALAIAVAGCATPATDASTPSFKTKRVEPQDNMLERTQPKAPPEKPVDDLPVEPIYTARA